MAMQILTGSIDKFRRDVPLADTTLSNPNGSIPLVQGEWLINLAAGYGRKASLTTTDVEILMTDGKPVPVYSQRGDTVVQAINKVNVIEHGGSYRMETDVYKTVNASDTGGRILTTSARGLQLTVATIESDSTDPHAGRMALRLAASGDPVVAILETPPSVAAGVIQVNVLPSPYPMQ